MFAGVGDSQVEYGVPRLTFVGVGDGDTEFAVPELVFVGRGNGDIEFSVPELVFAGVGDGDIDYAVPELIFAGTGNPDVEMTVPELVFVGLGDGATTTTPEPNVMPLEYCRRDGNGPPRAMGLVTGYGILLGERYQADQMSQAELTAAIRRMQAIVAAIYQGNAEAGCALIPAFEQDYGLTRPDMTLLPMAPQP